jgi:predicted amidohydrolase YtcJ
MDQAALYLERFMNYGITPEELRAGKPIIGIAQTGSDLSPCNRHHLDLAERVREGIREAGGILVLGSDWPVASYDAREVLAHAQLRRSPGSNGAPITPEQALTGLMALEGMTTQAALADGMEGQAGRIAVGFRADLTSLEIDPVTAPADELTDAAVPLTVSSGLVTHRER